MELIRLTVMLAATFCCFSTIGLAMAAPGESSVSMGHSTRVIMHSDKKRVSFPVNNNLSYPVLFHALVLDDEKSGYSPYFITSPEVTELKPNQTKMVQMVRLGGDFPMDRETLFYLQGHFLPSDVSTSSKKVGVNLSYALQMKLFFRPAKLKAEFDAIDEHMDEIDFKVVAGKLIAKNNSPYYLTINTLKTDKELINVQPARSMIKPFGTQEFDIHQHDPKTISWTLLNDGGFATEPMTRQL